MSKKHMKHLICDRCGAIHYLKLLSDYPLAYQSPPVDWYVSHDLDFCPTCFDMYREVCTRHEEDVNKLLGEQRQELIELGFVANYYLGKEEQEETKYAKNDI